MRKRHENMERTVIAVLCLAVLLTNLVITLIFPNDLGKSGIQFN